MRRRRWLTLVFLLAHVENYEVDLDNEEQHGEYLVGLVNEEEIAIGKSKATASCILIARPGTKPEEVKHLKAKFDGSTVSITGPAKSGSFVQHSDKWLGVLTTIEKKMQATKLKSRLHAIVTKFKKKGKAGSASKQKTTELSFASCGFSLSTKYFNAGMGDGELKLLPIPYTYEEEVGDSSNKVTEVMVVWRAFIEGSFEEVEEEEATEPEPDSDYDLMVELMKGNGI